MSRTLTVKLLGSGCSTGVPRVDGYWGACDPANPKNRRSRCSAWFGLSPDATPSAVTSVIVDTSPDFREQMLRGAITSIDSVLWTHDHADQTHGLDDLRAMTFGDGAAIEGHMDAATYQTLTRRFAYIFEGKHGYPAICRPRMIPEHGVPWTVSGPGGDLPIITFDQQHGPIRSVGYRIGDIAYSSDVSDLPEDSFEALQGLKLWIVDALRYKPHPTHAHLEKTLSWIERVRPERAVLTNLHQDMDYEALKRILPESVEPGFDQLTITMSL